MILHEEALLYFTALHATSKERKSKNIQEYARSRQLRLVILKGAF